MATRRNGNGNGNGGNHGTPVSYETGEYNGNPTLTIYGGFAPFTFGAAKARALLECMPQIQTLAQHVAPSRQIAPAASQASRTVGSARMQAGTLVNAPSAPVAPTVATAGENDLATVLAGMQAQIAAIMAGKGKARAVAAA